MKNNPNESYLGDCLWVEKEIHEGRVELVFSFGEESEAGKHRPNRIRASEKSFHLLEKFYYENFKDVVAPLVPEIFDRSWGVVCPYVKTAQDTIVEEMLKLFEDDVFAFNELLSRTTYGIVVFDFSSCTPDADLQVARQWLVDYPTEIDSMRYANILKSIVQFKGWRFEFEHEPYIFVVAIAVLERLKENEKNITGDQENSTRTADRKGETKA